MDKIVYLEVNDREIPLNSFVKDIFANVIESLVNCLDKIPEHINKIELTIEEEDKE